MRTLAFVLFSFLLLQCATTRSISQVVILNDPETSISVKPGAAFTVEIPLHAGTGYSWTYDSSKIQCHLISSSMKTLGQAMPGSPMHQVFELQAPVTFTGDVFHFVLIRPFEKGVSPAQTRILKVKKE